jgi:pimeloyl-ACP methyl ester carboxylesterase
MSVRRYGSGADIVYLHGLGEAGGCFESLIGEPVLAAFTHVVPDLPGYGRSAWPQRPESLDRVAGALARWLRRFKAPPVVVGHSMGGVLAVLIAEAAKERVAAVVNIDGNVSIGDCTYSGKAAPMSVEEMRGGGFERLRDEAYVDGAARVELRGYYAAMRFADPATYHRHACDLVALSMAETMAVRMAHLGVPCTYVAGVPGGACERSRELLAEAKVNWVGVEPAGHWVFADQPGVCARIIAGVRG